QTFHLPTNYRSLPPIVKAADAVICAGGQPALYQPAIPARSDPRVGDATIQIDSYDDSDEEAEALAMQIKNWMREDKARGGEQPKLRLSQIAVLYRTRDMSRPVEEALTRAKVPFRVIGGMPFWEYKEIRDVVAYLHVLLDPTRSDVFLERIINEPKRSIGGKLLDSLRSAARAAGTTLGALLLGD
ncbi:hypothetical protein Agub_g8672, partial [Astrephomene gubernaculifera]